MTVNLVGFLRERLAEDEAAARAATWCDDAAAWRAEPSPFGARDGGQRWYIEDAMDDGVVSHVDPAASDHEGVARHIARHDPARVVREIQAYRTTVDEYDIARELLPQRIRRRIGRGTRDPARGLPTYRRRARRPPRLPGGVASVTDPALTLFSVDLVSKWGFNDGDTPESWLDWCDTQGIDYNAFDFPWAALVRKHLVPVIEQDITVVEIMTMHNPIRAATVNGADVTEVWSGRAPEPTLTPDAVDVPMAEVLRLALDAADLVGCRHL
ncbi:DUF6221 family protein [Streptomyces niveus]|uniref:DUF6221 family protein n=1 Tax=Streptomyces niveus TaxID=193462 RepID=UPI00363E72F3